MNPIDQESARRTVCQMVAIIVRDYGGRDAHAVKLVAAATGWSEEAIARRLTDLPPAPDARETPSAPLDWETALETLLETAGRRPLAHLSRSLDAIAKAHPIDDAAPPPPSERVAAKMVRAVRGVCGWSDRQARYLLARLAYSAGGYLARLPEYEARLAVGLELGWFAAPARTARTRISSTGEGPTRKHAHSRTSRTTILPLHFLRHENVIESKVDSPSEPSVSDPPADADPPPLPLELVRQIGDLVEAYRDDHGLDPDVLLIDPAIVHGQATCLGLEVVPFPNGPLVMRREP